jgi:hypothetical protein
MKSSIAIMMRRELGEDASDTLGEDASLRARYLAFAEEVELQFPHTVVCADLRPVWVPTLLRCFEFDQFTTNASLQSDELKKAITTAIVYGIHKVVAVARQEIIHRINTSG